jgi:hypothetical protein
MNVNAALSGGQGSVARGREKERMLRAKELQSILQIHMKTL